MVEIIPAILTKDTDELRELISKAEGKVERIQIDIIDGKFADNKTIIPEEVEKISTNLKIDFHLMTNEPVEWVEKCVKAGADRVIGQVEKMTSQTEFLKKVRDSGILGGLALDINSKVSVIEPDALGLADVILVMSVKAGFGGQEFEEKALRKIDKLRKLRNEKSLNFRICDDGGMSLEMIGKTHFIGVDEVSIGRKLFNGELTENIEKFQKKAHII